MSLQHSVHRSEPETVPAGITSPRAKLVYLYVDVVGDCTVEDLQGCLDMRKIELFSVIDSLVSDGFITASDGSYATTA
jgi:hypothetical protein